MVRKILLGVIVIFLVAGIYIAYEISNAFHEMSIDTGGAIVKDRDDENNSNDDKQKDDKKKSNDFYALLIGLDSRGQSLTLNTDTIIVAHVLEDKKAVKLISLPRDLKVYNSNQVSKKINAIFAEGYQYARNEGRKNPDLLSGKTVNVGGFRLAEEYISSGMVTLREKVEDILDIEEISYTFIVNFNTVTELVDLVGGVEINVERSMHYDDSADGTSIHLEPGLQTLNGEQALNYARFRKDNRGANYASSDFDRGLRQQKVITALVDKLSSWSSLTKMNQIIDAVTKNVKTDMSRSKMISLARDLYGQVDGESIITIPLPSYWQSPFSYVNDEDMEQVKEQFHALTIEEADHTKDEDSAPDVPSSEQNDGSPTVADSVYGN